MLCSTDLVRIEELSKLFSQLSANHVQVFDLLALAGAGLTEERLYEMGKIKKPYPADRI